MFILERMKYLHCDDRNMKNSECSLCKARVLGELYDNDTTWLNRLGLSCAKLTSILSELPEQIIVAASEL